MAVVCQHIRHPLLDYLEQDTIRNHQNTRQHQHGILDTEILHPRILRLQQDYLELDIILNRQQGYLDMEVDIPIH